MGLNSHPFTIHRTRISQPYKLCDFLECIALGKKAGKIIAAKPINPKS